MLDGRGNLLTTYKAIQKRAMEVFADRLDNNKMNKNLEDLEEDTKQLCKIRLKL